MELRSNKGALLASRLWLQVLVRVRAWVFGVGRGAVSKQCALLATNRAQSERNNSALSSLIFDKWNWHVAIQATTQEAAITKTHITQMAIKREVGQFPCARFSASTQIEGLSFTSAQNPDCPGGESAPRTQHHHSPKSPTCSMPLS